MSDENHFLDLRLEYVPLPKLFLISNKNLFDQKLALFSNISKSLYNYSRTFRLEERLYR
jgi:hypothetical protein